MHEMRILRTGEVGPVGATPNNPKAGQGHVDKHGYRRIGRRGRARFEHREVMETVLGRPLRDFEYVHHKNGIRHDNQPDNLQLWMTPQPKGQRPEDLVEWMLDNYSDLVTEELARRAAALT